MWHAKLFRLFRFFFCVLLIAGPALPSVCADRPNILFIMSDDHAAAAWGIYPSRLQPHVVAPNIRRLADEGCRLDRAYATNSLCGPSRASILTGQYSHLNGVRTNADALDPQKETVPQWLHRGGYQTALFGKWHLKSMPSGFGTFNVLPGQGLYHDPILRNASNWTTGGATHDGFSADVITDEALQWLKEKSPDQPFFLMCHYKAPHEPFGYPERYANWLEDTEFEEPESIDEVGPRPSGRTFSGQTLDILAKRFHDDPERYQLTSFALPDSEAMTRRAAYQQLTRNFLRSVRAIDDNIGRLLKHLEKTGQLDNTVVIYTTDQGYFLGEHGFFDKRIMYEEAIQMPMVIRYPKEVPAKSINNDFVLNVDLPMLFLDYADLPVPPDRHGQSFRHNLKGETPADWRDAFYYRYWTHQENRPAHFGIRTRQFKLIQFYGKPLGLKGTYPFPTEQTWELYDLQNDPFESDNHYTNPAYEAVVSDLKDQLRVLQTAVGDSLQNANGPALNRP